MIAYVGLGANLGDAPATLAWALGALDALPATRVRARSSLYKSAPQDCAPEFAAEVFGHPEVGVLPRLVHSRFGLHVVEVLAREPGTQPPFEAVQAAVALSLRQMGYATTLRQCLQLLAADFEVEGVDLDRAASPLVQ